MLLNGLVRTLQKGLFMLKMILEPLQIQRAWKIFGWQLSILQIRSTPYAQHARHRDIGSKTSSAAYPAMPVACLLIKRSQKYGDVSNVNIEIPKVSRRSNLQTHPSAVTATRNLVYFTSFFVLLRHYSFQSLQMNLS